MFATRIQLKRAVLVAAAYRVIPPTVLAMGRLEHRGVMHKSTAIVDLSELAHAPRSVKQESIVEAL